MHGRHGRTTHATTNATATAAAAFEAAATAVVEAGAGAAAAAAPALCFTPEFRWNHYRKDGVSGVNVERERSAKRESFSVRDGSR